MSKCGTKELSGLPTFGGCIPRFGSKRPDGTDLAKKPGDAEDSFKPGDTGSI